MSRVKLSEVLRRRQGRLQAGVILAVIGFFLPLLPLAGVDRYDYRYLGLIGSVLRQRGFFVWGLVLLATGLCLILTAKVTPPEHLRVKVIRHTAQHIHLRITDGAGTREECYQRGSGLCPFSEEPEEE